jgi:hypothetical protein
MAERYLIDTCAVIKYLTLVFPAKGITFLDSVIDKESNISFISVIELNAWSPANPDEMLVYTKFISGSHILWINDAIMKQTIAIRKKQKLKIPDAIIAATALTSNFTLISDNDGDFKRIPGLKYVNPSNMK